MKGERALASPSTSAPKVASTVADAVAEAVAAAGATVAFAFPGGGSNLPLLDALSRNGVRPLLTHSEAGAAYMAGTTADLAGVPGVLVTGVGPGAASAVNGVAHAYLDRSPLLIVTDCYSPGEAASSGHQLIDERALLAPLVKYQAVLVPDSAANDVERALTIAMTHPRGPVHLELRRDTAGEETARRGPRLEQSLEAAVLPVGLARAVRDARHPVLLVGHEARHGVDQGALVRLAERLRAPVLSTYKAKGLFPETHDLAAGIVTGAVIERPLLDRADLLVGIGFDPIELLPRPWTVAAQLVALRSDPTPDRYLVPTLSASGSIGPLVEELAETAEPSSSAWTGVEAREAHASAREALRIGEGLTSWRVVEIVAEELGNERTVTVDAGAHMFAATSFWPSVRAGSFLISNGLATMGYAVPAAVAASLAQPDVGVVAFSGDGGFLLSAAELETAVRVGVSPLVVVLNDASLSLIRLKQNDLGLDRACVDYTRSDLARLAESLGAAGFSASSETELRGALQAAEQQPRAAVIDVSISGEEYGAMHRVIRG
jgi:acetolactate synthase-1/2/3 large subunit